MTLPKISKTSALGVLELTTAVIIAVSALPPKAGYAVLSVAVLRAVIRFLQTDADLLKPDSPGNPTDKPLEAHPVPNEPAAGQ